MKRMVFCSWEVIQKSTQSLHWKGAQKPPSTASSPPQESLLQYVQQWFSSLDLHPSGDGELITLQDSPKQNIRLSAKTLIGFPTWTEERENHTSLLQQHVEKSSLSPIDSPWDLKKLLNSVYPVDMHWEGKEGSRNSQPAATLPINRKALASTPSMTTLSRSHLLLLNHFQ